MEFFEGKVPSDAIYMKDGAWRAKIPASDGWVTYRPAGVASGKTKSTTATVEVNKTDVNLVSGDNILKFKFPLTGETGQGRAK